MVPQLLPAVLKVDEVVPATAVLRLLFQSQEIGVIYGKFSSPRFWSGSFIRSNQRVQELIDRVLGAPGKGIVNYFLADAVIDLVAPVCNYEIAHPFDGWIANIVEDYDTANIQNLIYEEEVDQRVVERVPAIDEREVYMLAAPNQRRQ